MFTKVKLSSGNAVPLSQFSLYRDSTHCNVMIIWVASQEIVDDNLYNGHSARERSAPHAKRICFSTPEGIV